MTSTAPTDCSDSFPPEPTSAIDWPNLGFTAREVNGHVETKYSRSKGKWTDPVFVEDPFLRIHGLAPGLNYGQQAFEGLKALRCKDGQIRIFRPEQNARRMQHSARTLALEPPPEELFLKCCNMAVAKNAEFVPPHETGASMYIRPNLFGSCAQLGLNPPDEYMFVVYVLPVGVYHGVKPVDGIILENFDRAAPYGTGSAKVGGNYAPVLPHSENAKKEGYGITLHMDPQTRTKIDEFSTSGFLGVKYGKKEGEQNTLVIPVSESVIKSVTSTSVVEIAKDQGFKVEQRPVYGEELAEFDEVMAAGTAAGLLPIKSITYRSKGKKFTYCEGDEPGECYKLLSGQLKGVQRGIVEDKWDWLRLVTPEK